MSYSCSARRTLACLQRRGIVDMLVYSAQIFRRAALHITGIASEPHPIPGAWVALIRLRVNSLPPKCVSIFSLRPVRHGMVFMNGGNCS